MAQQSTEEELRDRVAKNLKKVTFKAIVGKWIDIMFIFGLGFALCYLGFQGDTVNECNEFILEHYGIQTYYNGSDFLLNATPLQLLYNGTVESIDLGKNFTFGGR